jgi:hypothetical protein
MQCKGHVRFTPISDRKSGHAQMVMSALPLKADMCSARAHVCFGPIADIRLLFDYVISTRKQRRWQLQPERLCRFKIDH